MIVRTEVSGVFNYLAEAIDGQVKYTQQPERSVLNLDARTLPVRDIRSMTSAPTLEREGFMAAKLPLNVSGDDDPEQIATVYNPLLREFIADLTGAQKIVLRPPIVRWSRRAKVEDAYARGPATYVHGDFSQKAFHEMAAEAVSDDPDGEHWLAGRYSVIQTWRALTPPPQDFPLALLDRRTVGREELIDLRTINGGPGREQAYWNYSLKYNDAHQWYYCSDMTNDDVLVFIGSESTTEMPGILHSSFDNTALGQHATPRISCELRAFVYWGDAA